MAEDREMIEQIEQDERWLASLMEATPLPEAIDRVRQAVTIELDREVVERFADPLPDEAVLERTRAAVTAELNRSHRPLRSARTLRILEVLSAAAGLVLVVSLIRLAVPKASSPTADRRGNPSELVEQMALAFQSAGQRNDVALTVLAEDVSHLTESPQAGSYDASDAELREIGDEIDTLFIQQASSSES